MWVKLVKFLSISKLFNFFFYMIENCLLRCVVLGLYFKGERVDLCLLIIVRIKFLCVIFF